MPLWCAILKASREWGTPPWEWAGGDSLEWFYRWKFYDEQITAKAIRDAKKATNG